MVALDRVSLFFSLRFVALSSSQVWDPWGQASGWTHVKAMVKTIRFRGLKSGYIGSLLKGYYSLYKEF